MDGIAFNAALLELLGRTDGPAAQRALTECLEAAEGDFQAAVLRTMLARPGGEMAGRVARLAGRLGPPARRALTSDAALLEPVARLGLKDADPTIRLNIIDLLAEAAQPCCAYLLAGAVSDAASLIRDRAAAALLALTRRFRGQPALAEHIAPAVSQAMRSFPLHRSQNVLQAAVLLGQDCPADLLTQLNLPANQLSGPLTEALNALAAEDVAAFVLRSLGGRVVGAVGRAYIAGAEWATLGAWTGQEHWLALSGVRTALRGIGRLRAVAEDPAGLTELPAAQQPGALRLAMACGLDEPAQDTLLSLALMGEPATARAAMPFVLNGSPHFVELILMALHCPCPDVQSVAAAKMFAGGADRNLTEHLLEALPAMTDGVRGAVSQFLAADAFERYWKSYRKLGPSVRQSAGRALLKLDRKVADLIAGRLTGRDGVEQLQAAQMVRQLHMAEQFQDALRHLARHADKLVRATATTALGDCRGFQARSTLAGCLDDPDSRVQANAVEALAKAGADASCVRDKLLSEHNRVRANAIKWLLETSDAEAEMALASMLTDNRPAHRISALWVVKTLGHAAAGPILDRLAVSDAAPKVRARAATILRGLAAAAEGVGA